MRKNGTIVQYTAEEARKLMAERESQIDYARIDAMTEEELEASIDYEEEGHFEDWVRIEDLLTALTHAGLRQIDDDVLQWFTAKGPDFVQRINDALRDYIKAQETMSSAAD